MSLNLSWNGVDGRACVALAAALKRNRTLQSLDLSNTNIDSLSVELFVKALTHNTTLMSFKVRAPHLVSIVVVFVDVVISSIRGVHGNGNSHGNSIPMGIPWKWK